MLCFPDVNGSHRERLATDQTLGRTGMRADL